MAGTKADSLTRRWLGLPEDVRAALRLGFTGKAHLLDVAGRCLAADGPDLSAVAADALEAAVRENPLDGAMARDILASAQARSLLHPATSARLALLADRWRPPADLRAYQAVQAGRDFAAIKAYVGEQAASQPGNLFWVEQGVLAGCMDGDKDFCAKVIKFGMGNGVDELLEGASIRVDGLFFPRGRPDGEALCRRAAENFWNIGLVLRAFDNVSGAGGRRKLLPESVAVCLYTWNKADELDATLASLAESGLDRASLFVLDNGSTDHTGEVLDRWRSRFADRLGAGRFTVVTLPVNVGAPAARNWLMHREDVRAHGFVCFLDDDVELPPDWLARLGAAVAEYPAAGVWGCKVVDHANSLLIQSADGHLLPAPDKSMDLSRPAPHPFRLSDLHIRTLDGGDFDYLRPCASVTGCCHLFRAGTLADSGDFAIQLSPSQYDDMEHDLRLCEAGLFPVYQGHLAVRHKKRTGAASRVNPLEEGSALGNKYKMQAMHAPADILAAAEAEARLLDEDILRKLAFLERA
ncbi:MAG: glycosyltransferase [Desulfovibrionaceae bacterium]|nr:glycosyltransferase [Desulfovibrionaceae bacterium]